MNKIVIELSADDRALLNRIADNLEAFKASGVAFKTADATTPKAEGVNKPQDGKKTEEETNTQPVEEEADKTEKAPKEKVEENVPKVTVDDVRQVVVHLAANGKKAEARAIVNKYAKSVGEIPEDKIHEAFNELRAIVLEGASNG